MTKRQKTGMMAFALPMILFLILMAIMGQYPFGDHTLMILDMESQYHAFFTHLSDILHNDASPWYSFSRALGGDMISVAAYYLISPFNLLFFFFDAENIYAGIALVMLLKIGMIGFTMNYYLCRKKVEYSTLIFSTAFALSAYIVAYGSNIIWLDGIMILPIMILGIEKLVDEGKYLTYLLSIAFGVITSFYIGYMLCVFSVLYFVCYYFLISKEKRKGKTILVYAGSSLLGGLLSGVVAIPTLYAMQDGKGKLDLAALTNWSKTGSLRRLADNSFVGMIDNTQLSSGTPLIYAGVLSVLLLLLFFGLKEVCVKKKLAYAIMLCFMIFSMRHHSMCYIWQGFNVPNGAFYRFSFIYIFLLLVVANEAYGYLMEQGMDTWKKRLVLASTAILLFVLFVDYNTFRLIDHSGVWVINLILVLVYFLLLFWNWKKKGKTLLLLILMCTELCIGAVYHFHYAPLYQANTRVSTYDAYMQEVGTLVEEVKEDESFYRTVLAGNAYRTPSDNYLFNLYGLDSYTSLEQNSTQEAAFQFGYYRHMVFGVHYREGTTHAAESLLGVKYIITDEEPLSGYLQKDTEGEMGLYENQSALPFAMFANEKLTEIINEPYNTFQYQNDIYASLTESIAEPIFTQESLKPVNLENCVQNIDGTFTVIDAEKEAYVEMELQIEKEGRHYLQYMTADVDSITAFINGEAVDFSQTQNVVKQLGNLAEDELVVLRCYVTGDARNLNEVYVYQEDETVLAQYAKAVCAEDVTVSLISDDKLQIQCKNAKDEKQYLLFTMPADAGWTVKVDGTKTETYNVLHNLMAIAVEPGEHEIEMHYVPKGLKKGALLTAVSLLALIGIVLYGKKGKKKE